MSTPLRLSMRHQGFLWQAILCALITGCALTDETNLQDGTAPTAAQDENLQTGAYAITTSTADAGALEGSAVETTTATPEPDSALDPLGMAPAEPQCSQDEPAHAAREEAARLEAAARRYEHRPLPLGFVRRLPDGVAGMVGVEEFVVEPMEQLTLEEANRRSRAAVPPPDAAQRDEARRAYARDCPEERAESRACARHPYVVARAERDAATINTWMRPGGLNEGLTLEQVGMTARAADWVEPAADRR
jgi:hypothetical protein